VLDLSPLILPPFLQAGDLVKVIAPSGALKNAEVIAQSLEIWRSHGYRIEFTPQYQNCYSYLAGNDEDRRSALAQAWFDPECKAIICARGGYGTMRLLENWSWFDSKYPENKPKWLIGFSDITALLWNLAKAGITGLHAPVLTTLDQEPQWSTERLFNYLQGQPLPPLTGKGWGSGQVEGLLFPANLTVATHLIGTSLQPSLDGVILALEDVTESPYRIDRLLTQWRLSGLLNQVKGIALGRFSRCDAPVDSDSWTVEEVLSDRLYDLGIPIISNLPFGHDGVNACLPVGQKVLLDADEGLLKFEN
jgi:muramoyltetrapeptide carboxypeptidase